MMMAVLIRIKLFVFLLTSFSLLTGQSTYSVLVLGTSQDGGYPQYNCSKACCKAVWEGENERHYVSSLAVIKNEENKVWLIDCTPDFKEQMQLLNQYFKYEKFSLEGIFLTHAHIGHYLGLADLGREVTDSKNIPVYCMPRLKNFLENNGPWSQLVTLGNIQINELKEKSRVQISNGCTITPFLVPHRDEYSETVGYKIYSETHELLYIPDIDKWEKWDQSLPELLKTVNYAIVDGTFYGPDELGTRNMNEIPHPFVQETMKLLNSLPSSEKGKVYFSHLNHSNPLQFKEKAYSDVIQNNFNIAEQRQLFQMSK